MIACNSYAMIAIVSTVGHITKRPLTKYAELTYRHLVHLSASPCQSTLELEDTGSVNYCRHPFECGSDRIIAVGTTRRSNAGLTRTRHKENIPASLNDRTAGRVEAEECKGITYVKPDVTARHGTNEGIGGQEQGRGRSQRKTKPL